MNPYGTIQANYFPFLYFLSYLFTLIPKVTSFYVFTSSFVLFFLVYLYKNIPLESKMVRIPIIFILSFMAYPFLYTLDRGNFETWVFITMVLFIYFYRTGKFFLSVLFLSMSIALKAYPATLLILFVIDKRYWLVVFTCASALLISVLSASVFHGGLMASIKGLGASLSDFNSGALLYQGLQHNTSFFAPLKLLYDHILLNMSAFSIENGKLFFNVYYLFAIVFFGIELFFIFRYKMAFWKTIALLVLSFISLPQVAFDYKLISLFIPLILFIQSEERSRYVVYYSILFGLLLIPKDYYILVADVSISSVINPILIAFMIGLICFEAARSGKRLQFFGVNRKESVQLINHVN